MKEVNTSNFTYIEAPLRISSDGRKTFLSDVQAFYDSGVDPRVRPITINEVHHGVVGYHNNKNYPPKVMVKEQGQPHQILYHPQQRVSHMSYGNNILDNRNHRVSQEIRQRNFMNRQPNQHHLPYQNIRFSQNFMQKEEKQRASIGKINLKQLHEENRKTYEIQQLKSQPIIQIQPITAHQSYYGHNKSIPPPIAGRAQSKNSCINWVLGILGVLALAGLIAALVLSLKGKDTQEKQKSKGITQAKGLTITSLQNPELSLYDDNTITIETTIIDRKNTRTSSGTSPQHDQTAKGEVQSFHKLRSNNQHFVDSLHSSI